MITREQLVEMFEGIANDAKWDMSKPMVWGYFFTDSSRRKLEKAAPVLEGQGYRVVDIYMSEKDDPEEPDIWWLHVEKIEVHNVETLDARNQDLYRLADTLGLESYDGMDVGPVEPKH